jgi:hypothetical protein
MYLHQALGSMLPLLSGLFITSAGNELSMSGLSDIFNYQVPGSEGISIHIPALIQPESSWRSTASTAFCPEFLLDGFGVQERRRTVLSTAFRPKFLLDGFDMQERRRTVLSTVVCPRFWFDGFGVWIRLFPWFPHALSIGYTTPSYSPLDSSHTSEASFMLSNS